MNQQTDNMYIDDRYSDEALRKREEIREHISWFREFLTFGTSLPEHIRRRYGLEEDYQRYKKLEIQVHRMPAEPDCRGYGKEQRMKELCEAGKAKGKNHSCGGKGLRKHLPRSGKGLSGRKISGTALSERYGVPERL